MQVHASQVLGWPVHRDQQHELSSLVLLNKRCNKSEVLRLKLLLEELTGSVVKEAQYIPVLIGMVVSPTKDLSRLELEGATAKDKGHVS